MDQTISVEEVIKIITDSDLDQTIKDILIRDLRKEGVNDFLLEQVIAYCENASALLKKYLPNVQNTNSHP